MRRASTVRVYYLFGTGGVNAARLNSTRIQMRTDSKSLIRATPHREVRVITPNPLRHHRCRRAAYRRVQGMVWLRSTKRSG